MDQFFIYIYPLVTIISVIGYLPQIKTLITTRTNCADIALSSWTLWLVSSAISVGYGVFYLKDTMFIITCAANLCLVGTVIALVIYRRQQWTALENANALNV